VLSAYKLGMGTCGLSPGATRNLYTPFALSGTYAFPYAEEPFTKFKTSMTFFAKDTIPRSIQNSVATHFLELSMLIFPVTHGSVR
jgi:hypothetical protein